MSGDEMADRDGSGNDGTNGTSRGNRRTPKFRRRAEARPDEVLDAALELFMEKGFETTRVEDIARRAGLSKGSVYLYFSSKEALLEGLVQRAVVPVADNALSLAHSAGDDPKAAIVMVLRTLAERFSDPRLVAIPKIVIREATVVPAVANMYRAHVLDRAIPVISGLISAGIAKGQFRPVDPELTVRSIVGPILAHMLLAEIFGIAPEGGGDPEVFIENHLSVLFDGLAADAGGGDE